jgi:branched-chain amino acid aminotransferase
MALPAKIWMDGTLVDGEKATVSVLAHTLHYGDGVFEGIRCYKTAKGRAIFRYEEHMDRLLDSARCLGMEVPYTLAELMAAGIETVKANDLPACYIRPLIIRGLGALGVNPVGARIQVIIAVWVWGAYLGDEEAEKGARIITSSFARNHPNAVLTKAKATGAYVNAVLAKLEAVKHGFKEALMLDTQGYVSEGAGENVFFLRHGRLYAGHAATILEGITRASVMEIAKDEGLEVSEVMATRDQLYNADEVFLTGTAAEITPVREIDFRAIGSGAVGPVTARIRDRFRAITEGREPRYARWLTYVDKAKAGKR